MAAATGANWRQSAVIVAGVAGGLDPTLRPGDVVVATEVRDGRGRIVQRGRSAAGRRVAPHGAARSHRPDRQLLTTSCAAHARSSAARRDRRDRRRHGVRRDRAGSRRRPDCGRSGHRRHGVPPDDQPEHGDRRRAGAADAAQDRVRRCGVGPTWSVRGGCCSRHPGRSAPASNGPSTSSSWPCSATRDPSTCGARSCTTRTSSPTSSGRALCSSTNSTRYPTGRRWCSRRTASHPPSGMRLRDAASTSSTPPARWWPRSTARPAASSARGDTVLLIGHAGHDEIEGTMGEAPGTIQLVAERRRRRAGQRGRTPSTCRS